MTDAHDKVNSPLNIISEITIHTSTTTRIRPMTDEILPIRYEVNVLHIDLHAPSANAEPL